MSSFPNFAELYCAPNESAVALDLSCMNFPPDFFAAMEPQMQAAFRAMAELEGGSIANPDEKRMVGHYWLRNHDLIPDATVRAQVTADFAALRKLIDDIHSRRITAENGLPFRRLLSIGIGGSALGPEFVADALGKDAHDRLTPYFLDNTDPEGIARVLAQLDGKLGETLVLVISKSGGTPETRNGMLLAEAAWKASKLNFGRAAIAITGTGSVLYNYAQKNNWLAMLPMYDWVGGRTSVMSQVGLLPAGLQGVDIDGFLSGAGEMDALTRRPITRENPAAMLALAWFHGTKGRGDKDMVILPYKDRLILFSRYLQQLIMESLGKEHDLDGKVVHQGIAVYGNKGSTDQHAYIQQLRDGTNNFFAVFVEVLRDGGASSFEVDPGVTAGDYLSGFFQGTRQALRESGRMSLTLTVDAVDARTVGALIALFERAVGLYATLVNINAYHQPGVEAGKKAAAVVLADQAKLLAEIRNSATPRTASAVAAAAGADPERAFRILQHLAANKRGVVMAGRHPLTATFAAA